MNLTTALKFVLASALVLGPAAGANAKAATKRDIRGGKDEDSLAEAHAMIREAHAMIRTLQEEVSQLKGRRLTTSDLDDGEDVTIDTIGEKDPYAAKDLCETAQRLNQIPPDTKTQAQSHNTNGKKMEDHKHSYNVMHKHTITQRDHKHSINDMHMHHVDLPAIQCHCDYVRPGSWSRRKAEEATDTDPEGVDTDTEEVDIDHGSYRISTSKYAGTGNSGSASANISVDKALLTSRTTGTSDTPFDHNHGLRPLLVETDQVALELGFAATTFGSGQTCNIGAILSSTEVNEANATDTTENSTNTEN